MDGVPASGNFAEAEQIAASARKIREVGPVLGKEEAEKRDRENEQRAEMYKDVAIKKQRVYYFSNKPDGQQRIQCNIEYNKRGLSDNQYFLKDLAKGSVLDEIDSYYPEYGYVTQSGEALKDVHTAPYRTK